MSANKQLTNYSLPGVMLYLQSEWTRNQRDRTQWENERGELMSKIERLTRENTDLKKKVIELEKLSSKSGAHFVNGRTQQDAVVSGNEVETLKNAREYLNKRMKDVMSILNNQEKVTENNGDASLGLKHTSQFFGGSQKKAPFGNAPDPNLQDQDQDEDQLLQEAISVLKTSKLDDGNETDTETITANEEDENEKNSSSRALEKTKDTSTNGNNINHNTNPIDFKSSESESKKFFTQIPEFVLASHTDQVNQIQINGNHILTSSIGGLINLWDISKYFSTTENETPIKSFHHDGIVKQLKWQDDKKFITLDNNSNIRFWNINYDTQIFIISNRFKNVTNFDLIKISTNETILVVNTDDSLNIIEINGDGNKFIKSELTGDYAIIQDKDIGFLLLKDTIIKFHLKNGEQDGVLTINVNLEGKKIIKFEKIDENYWLFITDQDIILYNHIQKKTIFEHKAVLTNSKFVKDQLVLFYPNGDIEIYKRPSLIKDINDDTSRPFTLKSKFNHYESLFGFDWDQLSNSEQEILKNTNNYGNINDTGNYLFSCGEDGDIRVFQVNNIQ